MGRTLLPSHVRRIGVGQKNQNLRRGGRRDLNLAPSHHQGAGCMSQPFESSTYCLRRLLCTEDGLFSSEGVLLFAIGLAAAGASVRLLFAV